MGAAGAAALAMAGALLVSAPAHAASGGEGIICDSWDDGSVAYASCTGVNPNDTMIPWQLRVDCVRYSWTGRPSYEHSSKRGVSDGTVISLGCASWSYDLDSYEAEII